MALADLRLGLMTFAQRWDGATLRATVLLLPAGDPFAPLLGGATAPFAGTAVKLRAATIAGLDAMPQTTAPDSFALTLAAPANAGGLFAHLRDTFKPIDQTATPPNAQRTAVRKALPDTYLGQLPPGKRLAAQIASADEFGCALRGQEPAPLNPGRPDPSWGHVISHALRNPFLADALGLRYTFDVPAPQSQAYAGGGWLFVTLDAEDGGTGYAAAWASDADLVKTYAARIPALKSAGARCVFTAVLFPVANPGPVVHPTPAVPDEGALDRAILEAETYDDGFAKIVHGRQPDSLDAAVGDGKVNVNAASDAGVQLGWDDEQVVAWHNRQLAIAQAAAAGQAPQVEAPLGVLGYRVDVREPVAGETPAQRDLGWQTLMSASGTIPPALSGTVANFTGELVVEPTPSSPASVRDFWLPLYFAQWRGGPLGTRDDVPHLLAGGTAAKNAQATTLAASSFDGTTAARLLYGHTYEFRVRMSDMSGGGPIVSDVPLNDAAAERARVPFSRYVPPKACRIAPAFDAAHAAPHVDRITVSRPTINYPEALFTPRYGTDERIASATVSALLAQLGLAPDGTPSGPPAAANDVVSTGVPDPDVTQIEIVVEARALAHDRADDVSDDGAFIELYRATRPLPALPPIPVQADGSVRSSDVVADAPVPPLELAYVDVDDATTLAATASGPLPVPRSRDVRIVVTPLASGPPGYFGTLPAGSTRPPLTRGNGAHLVVRAAAATEATPLFAVPAGAPAAQAFFFQPVTDGDPVAGVMSRVADRLGLQFEGLTLRARPGERVVFGAGKAFKHLVSPDGGSVTFGAPAELFRNWMVPLQAELLRDWTWEGLANGVISVRSGGTEIDTIVVPRVATPESIAMPPDRSRTRIVYLDGIDPTVPNAADGFTNRPPYSLAVTIPADGGAPISIVTPEVALRLPVTVQPAGVPALVSAGYALSGYSASPDYSSTAPRKRQLWLELSEAPAAGDALFARVLAYAPDPLLYLEADLLAAEPSQEPELKLDAELMRIITPGQPRDQDGREAMVQLTASPDNPLQFLLPLPDGVDENDPQLFGLWTYELRFGHVAPWSTAHGRFGRPLRVAGVQHPAPPMKIAAAWETVRRFLPAVPVAEEPALLELESAVGTRAAARLHTFAITEITATAPYAVPVLGGRRVGSGYPLTVIGFLLYAQAMQADGSGHRNILLAHRAAQPVPADGGGTHVDVGRAAFLHADVIAALQEFGLPADAPLSVLAVEFYDHLPPLFQRELHDGFVDERTVARERTVPDPFERGAFAQRRILRTSPLTRIEPTC